MAWTTPRTWVDEELITHTILNTHIKDNLDYLYALANPADDVPFFLGTDDDIALVLNSAGLAADAELANVIVGTSEHPGCAANSFILSNVTASGDILLLVNKGGHSQGVFWADGSTGDTAIMAASGASVDVYVAGTKEIDYATATLAFQQASTIKTTTGTLTIDGDDGIILQTTGSGLISIPTDKVTQAWTTIEATAGEQGFKMTTTDSVVQTAGIIQSLLIDHNITGAKSSSAQIEAISVDMNIGANIIYAYPIAVYVSQSGNPNITFVAGMQIYMEDMGSGTIGAVAGLDVQIGSTNLGSRHTGLRLVSHTGTARSGILFEKAWTVGIDLSGTGSGGVAATMATADIRFHHGATLLDDGTNLTLAGANLVGTLGAITLAGAVTGGSQNMTGMGSINGLVITANTGAITSGSWAGTVIPANYGGTGVANNVASTLTITGAYTLAFTIGANTGVTLPASGTLATLAGTEELTNKTLNASIAKGTWTADGTWTIPAVTLNGTVTCGANRIFDAVSGSIFINTTGSLVGLGLVGSHTSHGPVMSFEQSDTTPPLNSVIGGFYFKSYDGNASPVLKTNATISVTNSNVTDNTESSKLNIYLTAAGVVDNLAMTLTGAGDLWIDRNLLMDTGYIRLTEMAAPGALGANTAGIYAVVGGDTLTDLAAVFQDGTVDIFAQESTDPDSPIFQFPDNTELKTFMRKPDRKTIQFVSVFPDGREFVMRELRYPSERW